MVFRDLTIPTTRFYGVTNMHMEFQKCTHEIPNGIYIRMRSSTALVVTKGSPEEHLKRRIVLNRLNDSKNRLELEKCKLAESKVDWLGFKLSRSGV